MGLDKSPDRGRWRLICGASESALVTRIVGNCARHIALSQTSANQPLIDRCGVRIEIERPEIDRPCSFGVALKLALLADTACKIDELAAHAFGHRQQPGAEALVEQQRTRKVEELAFELRRGRVTLHLRPWSLFDTGLPLGEVDPYLVRC